MKLKYEAKLRNRIKYGFVGFTTFGDCYFNCDKKVWEDNPIFEKYRYSTHKDCKSIRAFRRKLKKSPSGVTFVLCSRWRGYDVIGVGTKN